MYISLLLFSLDNLQILNFVFIGKRDFFYREFAHIAVPDAFGVERVFRQDGAGEAAQTLGGAEVGLVFSRVRAAATITVKVPARGELPTPGIEMEKF